VEVGAGVTHGGTSQAPVPAQSEPTGYGRPTPQGAPAEAAAGPAIGQFVALDGPVRVRPESELSPAEEGAEGAEVGLRPWKRGQGGGYAQRSRFALPLPSFIPSFN
jgi:hypothetical protein